MSLTGDPVNRLDKHLRLLRRLKVELEAATNEMEDMRSALLMQAGMARRRERGKALDAALEAARSTPRSQD